MWHSPLYGFGGHSGGVVGCLEASSLAARAGGTNCTDSEFGDFWKDIENQYYSRYSKDNLLFYMD